MGNEWEALFTVFILSSWFLFPIGMFLSIGRLDKDTDQVIQLESHRDAGSVPARPSKPSDVRKAA